MKRLSFLTTGTLMLISLANAARAADDRHEPIIPDLSPSPTMSASTIPAKGDLNPYGVAFVPKGFPANGSLKPGDILVSNFNNGANLQGTGTTIVRVTPSGQASVFFEGQRGLGLTTALGVLRRGFVIVGNVPTTDGTCSTVQQGSLLIIDRNGVQLSSLTDATLLDGPWDLAIHDQGEQVQLFVSNVLSGTVTRLDLRAPENGQNITVQSKIQIASGYLHRCDPSALVVGPTGLAYDHAKDILYVASTGDNVIFSISDARKRQSDGGVGTMIYQDNTHLHGPLALLLAPNGDLITANGDAVNPDPTQPSELVEFTPAGQFVAQVPVNSSATGGAFGIALSSSGNRIRFAAVDDILNALDVWNIE